MNAETVLSIDPRVLERFPGYSAAIVYARNLNSAVVEAPGERSLAASEEAARTAFAGQTIQSHPHVRAWRDAYGAFGSKPSKYLCSAEALLRRVVRGEALPRVNPWVDLYNAISLRHALPAGGEDLDRITGGLELTFASGGEPFDAGEPDDRPYAGEVVWRDAAGVTCRRWNWRQCRRTRLAEETRNAYFVLDLLAPYPVEILRTAAAELVEGLSERSPGCEVATEWIGGCI